MYGWLWTNECCMCARSTHDEVGRFGRVGHRKADFGLVLSSPRGGFGGSWGVMDSQSRAQKWAQGPERCVWSGVGHKSELLGAHPGRTGGTTGGRLVSSVSSGRLTSRVESVLGQIQALHSAEIPQRSPGAMAVIECARRGVLCFALCGPIVGAHAADLGAYKCAPTF